MHWPQNKWYIILKSNHRKWSICIGPKAKDTLSWNQKTGIVAFALAPRQMIHYPEIKPQEMEHLHWHQGKSYIILKSKHRKWSICIGTKANHTLSWNQNTGNVFAFAKRNHMNLNVHVPGLQNMHTCLHRAALRKKAAISIEYLYGFINIWFVHLVVSIPEHERIEF